MQKSKNAGYIQGTRIELRPIICDHAEIYVTWYNDLDIRRLARMIRPVSVENFRKSINNIYNATDRIKFEIWHIADEKPIGDVGLGDIEYHDRNAQFGIMIGDKNYWNQGYATEALQLILKYAFEEVNLHKVWGSISDWNKGSQKVAIKAGMHLEATKKEDWYIDGEYVDTHIYAIFKRDWFKK